MSAGRGISWSGLQRLLIGEDEVVELDFRIEGQVVDVDVVFGRHKKALGIYLYQLIHCRESGYFPALVVWGAHTSVDKLSKGVVGSSWLRGFCESWT